MRSEYTGRARGLPLRQLLIAALALLLAACGSSTQLHPSYPILTMTASNSGFKFASYVVSVNYITLTEKSGQVVTMLPIAQTVDLARLSDMAELVSAYSVPQGTYTSASVQLTFISMDVNLNGKAVPATFVDNTGAALTVANVTVTFDPAKPLVLPLQQATPVNLNFDLMAFNSISSSATAPVVTVQPYLALKPATITATPLRARGQFVIAQSNYFVMNLRPFYGINGTGIGAVVVTPTANAYYSINGVVYTGAAGLAALAQIPIVTVIAAYGRLTGTSGGSDPNLATTPAFSATEIYAGTSQENGLSYVQGMVSARAGDKVTLHGVTALYYNGTVSYYNGAIATVAAGTPVTQDGMNVTGLTVQDISVGQNVYVSGNDTDFTSGLPVLDSAGNLLMDATLGSVRLLHTRLWGALSTTAPTNATFDLLTLGIYPPSVYSFAGTGTPPADAAAYLVSTPTDLSATAAGTLMAIDGATTAFGAAPPDFVASAVTPGSSIQQTLVVDWPSGEASPFLSASSSGYVVNLSKATIGTINDIFSGPAGMELKLLPASPLITTTGADQSTLELSVGSSALTTGTSVFATPSAYYSGVNSALNGTNKLIRLVAAGQYNSVSNTFVAQRISMALHE